MAWKKLRSYLMAASYDLLMRGSERRCLSDWRRELLVLAQGETLEIGAGTGLNLPFYPPTVKQLYLAEPDRQMRRKLAAKTDRLTSSPAARIVPWRAETIDLPDSSCDTIVTTLVLCSVASLEESLAEIRRLLRPGGRLLFLEHIISAQPRTRALQRQIEPLWGLCAGECRLTRDTASAIRTEGLKIETLIEARLLGAPGFVNRTVRGWASRRQ